MLPDRVSNPGPLTYESGALRIALRGPAGKQLDISLKYLKKKLNSNKPTIRSPALVRLRRINNKSTVFFRL